MFFLNNTKNNNNSLEVIKKGPDDVVNYVNQLIKISDTGSVG